MGKNGRLEIAGLKELSEPADLIWADRQSLERLVIALTRLRIPLILDRFPQTLHQLMHLKSFSRKGCGSMQRRCQLPVHIA
jgi:hypothetical protein